MFAAGVAILIATNLSFHMYLIPAQCTHSFYNKTCLLLPIRVGIKRFSRGIKWVANFFSSLAKNAAKIFSVKIHLTPLINNVCGLVPKNV